MSLTVFIVILLLVLLFNFLVSGGLMWLSCRIFRLKEVSYRRALGAVIVVGVVSTLMSVLLAIVIAVLFRSNLPPVLELPIDLVALLVSYLVAFQSLARILRTSRLRALGVGVSYLVLSAVYVVVFVVIVRFSVCEAFVIPTGAEAPSLLGYHKTVACPQCGWEFDVNSSVEVSEDPRARSQVVQGTCPNCRADVDFTALRPPPSPTGGDRILTVRHRLDGILRQPQRFDSMTFHYPDRGRNSPDLMYVKRLMGLPGETIGIHGGDLYVTTALTHNDQVDPENRRTLTHSDDEEAQKLFQAGKFEIVRKPPELILAVRRLVYDVDHPAADLAGDPPRWLADEGLKPDDDKQPRSFQSQANAETAWLTYRHLLRGRDQPQLITDFESYNSYSDAGGVFADSRRRRLGGDWVGDLLLECEVVVDKSEGELLLELGRGPERFQARWDLATGVCTLLRIAEGREQQLDRRPTGVNRPGSHRLRFANVDQRLTVWVGDELPFDSGVAYDAATNAGPTAEDLQPARVGAKGASIRVQHLQLWRDVYYTGEPGRPDTVGVMEDDDWSDPTKWAPLRDRRLRTFFVQPGHYFFLGDNSSASSDSRYWGLVPESLLHGRVLLIYYPLTRAGRVH
jgi:signal peptidase I